MTLQRIRKIVIQPTYLNIPYICNLFYTGRTYETQIFKQNNYKKYPQKVYAVLFFQFEKFYTGQFFGTRDAITS